MGFILISSLSEGLYGLASFCFGQALYADDIFRSTTKESLNTLLMLAIFGINEIRTVIIIYCDGCQGIRVSTQLNQKLYLHTLSMYKESQ